MDNNDNQAFKNLELIAVLFVSHGSRGDHLLFKYPYLNDDYKQLISNNKKSGYFLDTNLLNFWIIDREPKLITNGVLKGLENTIVANTCVGNKDVKNKPLELKIDNVFFLGSSYNLSFNNVLYNVVFAVKSPLPKPVISCYQALSLAITKTLKKEEIINNYLTIQSKILFDCLDDGQAKENEAFALALEKSELAKGLKKIYENVITTGIVDVYLNSSCHLSFCLPHIAYKITEKCEQIFFVNAVLKAAHYLKPYHAILLLNSQEELLKSLPPNCNYYAQRLIEIYNPRYSIARYAAELDVPIKEIYSIVDHFVYWAKVKIIYPIAENNIYVIQPKVDLDINGRLSKLFSERFPYQPPLAVILEKFSFARALVNNFDILQTKEQHADFVNIVIWLLERNILLQLHTHIYLIIKVKFKETENELKTNVSSDNFNSLMKLENSNDDEDDQINGKFNMNLNFETYRKSLIDNNIEINDTNLILKYFEDKKDKEIRLFLRLLPYFNGQANIEEIIYYEKLSRSDIYMILDLFKELLTTCVYEDSNPLITINVKVSN